MTGHVPIGAISAFRRRLPRVSVRGAAQPGQPGRRPSPRRPARGSEPPGHRRPRPRAVRLRPPPAPDRPGAPAAGRAGRAPDRRRQHRGADVRARGGPDLGPQPADLRRRSSARSLAGQALFAYAPEAERARRVVSKLRQVPRLVQAARDNIKDCPGHLRQGRPRDLARRAEVHRDAICRGRSPRSTTCTSSATSPTRRPRPPRRSSRLHRLPRDRPRAAREGLVPSRARALRAEAEARGGHHAERRAPAGDRAARAARGAGGIPQRRRPAERRRPARGLARRPRSSIPQPGSSSPPRRRRSRSSRSSCSGSRSSRCPTPSRSSSRRRPSSTAGRSPACGRRARSRASRAAPTTT